MPDSNTPTENQTILVVEPKTDQVGLVISIIFDPETLDLERLLSAMVPELARGGVRGGMLVVGDSVLVIRNTGTEVLVDEVDLDELLALAGIDEPWTVENLVEQMRHWIAVMAGDWRGRLVGRIRELLVPHVVSGLAGEVQVCDGVWGLTAHRVAAEDD